MAYPFLSVNQFDYQISYTIPNTLTGRLDLIAQALYGYDYFYKPLAVANGIAMPMGCRLGIRKTYDAIRNELYQDGLRGVDLEVAYNIIITERINSDYDWYMYVDSTAGMVSDAYGGRIIQVPTFESANAWLLKYQYPENITPIVTEVPS